MILNKRINLRIQDLDFELLRKEARRQFVPLSELLREILKDWLKKELKKLEGGK